MRIILPTIEQTTQINASRTRQGQLMAQAGTLEGPLAMQGGPCATDDNRHPNGEFATVRHITVMSEAADELPDIEYEGRLNGAKPRTCDGTTGLIHEDPEAYGRIASALTNRGIRLVAEIMDESDAAIAGPWLTGRWVGTRNLQDTGARQLMRPTEHEFAAHIVPTPAFVKSDADGNWAPTRNALAAIRDEKPVPRSLLTLSGLQRTVTHANPHTGLILRGNMPRPAGPLDEVLAEEITTARQRLDSEFGEGAVALYVDISHGHAKWEGGGEEGQLAIARSLADLMTKHNIIIDGVMAETYLLPGNQPETGTVPGLSRVDKCVRQAAAIGIMQFLNDARAAQQLALSEAVRR